MTIIMAFNRIEIENIPSVWFVGESGSDRSSKISKAFRIGGRSDRNVALIENLT